MLKLSNISAWATKSSNSTTILNRSRGYVLLFTLSFLFFPVLLKFAPICASTKFQSGTSKTYIWAFRIAQMYRVIEWLDKSSSHRLLVSLDSRRVGANNKQTEAGTERKGQRCKHQSNSSDGKCSFASWARFPSRKFVEWYIRGEMQAPDGGHGFAGGSGRKIWVTGNRGKKTRIQRRRNKGRPPRQQRRRQKRVGLKKKATRNRFPGKGSDQLDASKFSARFCALHRGFPGHIYAPETEEEIFVDITSRPKRGPMLRSADRYLTFLSSNVSTLCTFVCLSFFLSIFFR